MDTDKDLTIIDYFAVIGLDKSTGLKTDPSSELLSELSATSINNESLPPLERSYEAKVLSYFPQKRRGHPFPQEIASLSMPKGLKFYTENNVPMEPQFHSYVVIREDGTRVNGCTLTLFEEVKDEDIKEQMLLLHKDHVKEIANNSNNQYDNRIKQQPGTISFGNHTMPRHISVKKNQRKRVSYYDNLSKPIYVSKCITLLTRIPIIFTSEKILRYISDIIKPNLYNLPISLESFIYWLLHEVPLPVENTTLQLNYLGLDIIVIRPSNNELPYFDYPLQYLFSFIPVDKFLKLLTCFLLEHQILLCSKYMDRLMLVGESLCTLIFPFRYQLTYVPILPYNQLKFIEAPVPYLMGLCYDDKIPDQIYQSNICILDIDNKKLDYPEDVPPFPKYRQLSDEIIKIIKQLRTSSVKNPQQQQQSEENNEDDEQNYQPKIVLRKKKDKRQDLMSFKRISRSFDNPEDILSTEELYKQQLEKEESIINDTININNTTNPIINKETENYFQGLRFNQAIRDLLLNHFSCLFYSYESFVINDNTTQIRDSVVNFDKASFLSDQPDSFLPFLAAFLETQMFASFIDSKILTQIEKNYDENIKIFDEKILQVRERLARLKVQTPTIEKPSDILLAEETREVFKPLPISSIQTDYEVRQPRKIQGTVIRNYGGFFPDMDSRLFENIISINSTNSPWKQQKQRQRTNSLFEETGIITPKNTPTKKKQSDESSKSKEHWKFVEQLLKETKTKTKRMLVMKMGKEAVHLGHNDVGITGVEENTLVATFCDLLERVWTHGLKKKQGKSALWTHVLRHQEKEKDLSNNLKNVEHSSNLTPEFLPVPPETIHLFNNDDKTENENNTEEKRDSLGGINGVVEMLKYLNPSSNATTVNDAENVVEDSIWSKSFSKAANFIADKLSQVEASEENQPMMTEDSENVFEDERLSRRRESHKPLSRSSSVTRFTSWARSTFNNATTVVTKNIQNREGIGNQGSIGMKSHLPPTGNLSRSRVADISRPPIRMHKSSSVSDFAPHWSGDSTSIPSSSSSSLVGGINTLNFPLSPAKTRQNQKRSLSRPRSPIEKDKHLSPLPTSIAYDLKSVMEMNEIKTDIGCARAFVRLSLERKLLHKHLKTIFSNEHLLHKMYKRYAFLRSEDEREQFLYHILSLNAVDFSCFTNTFIATKMQYEVLLVGGLDRFSSASVWLMITGSLSNTPIINLPQNTLQFTFDHKNLGVLSTLRIGHNLSHKSVNPSKWFLDYILVRNNITGQTFRFNCGRWFGKGVDDGALERLLVAEVLSRETTDSDGMIVSGNVFGGLISRPESPISGIFSTNSLSNRTNQGGFSYSTQSLARKKRSPSVTKNQQNSDGNMLLSDIHHQLGVSVNALVKHFLTDQTYVATGGASLTLLLCGENGLISILEQIFSIGRKKDLYNYFQRLYPWDYIDAVFVWFVAFFNHGDSRKLSNEQRSLIIYARQLVRKIKENTAVGKDGKFQVFILFTIRDHILSSLLSLMVWTPVTSKMYTDDAFIRQPTHVSYLSKLLASLNEFNFTLEKSLTHGIDI